ncbi:MAG: thioredoxin domain-containing protein [Candidatus Binataceae bacterium]
MRAALTRAWLATLLIFTAGLAQGHAAESKDQVLALVGKHPITEDDVERQASADLTSVESQIYVLQKQAIQKMVAEYVVREAAARAHLSLADYIKREIDDKVKDPSEAELRQAYDRLKFQLARPYEEAKPDLVTGLREQQRQQLNDQLMGGLLKEARYKLLLSPRFPIDTRNRPSRGPARAPVTIVEFADFQSPFTPKAEEVLNRVRAHYRGKVRLVFFDYPVVALHPLDMKAALAARCAGEQGKFWPYHDALIADVSKLVVTDLKATAAKLRLNTAKFNACLDQEKYHEAVLHDGAEARLLSVEGTPMLYVNGRPLFGVPQPGELEGMIDEELTPAGHGLAASRRAPRDR